MKNKNTNQNLIPTGKTIKENIVSLGMTQKEFATRMDITEKHVIDLIKGRSALTPEVAIGLANVIGSSPKFWMNLESRYQIEKIKYQDTEVLKKEMEMLPLFKNTYGHLRKLNYVADTRIRIEKIFNLHQYYGVINLTRVGFVHNMEFRKTDSSKIDKFALAAWLRQGELKANSETIQAYNKSKLISSINELRNLNITKPEYYSRMIKELLNKAGVKVYYTDYFPKTYANGCVFWLGDNPVVVVSLRYSYEDTFWFTLMHEIGHVLLHGKSERFIEYETEIKDNTTKEKQADEFAQNQLLDSEKYQAFLLKGDFSIQSISIFAKANSVQPGIVAGRLAHEPTLNEYGFQFASRLRKKIKINRNDHK